MNKPLPLAKRAISIAAAAMTLSGVLSATLATPAAAQPAEGYYYNPCQQDQNNRAVAGGLLGAATGALIGNSVASGGGRTGGTIIGGLAGAAVGAKIGQSTAACGNGPPPAPAGYYQDEPPPPPPPPPPPQCGRAMERITYPDGSLQTYWARACTTPDGRWYIVR